VHASVVPSIPKARSIKRNKGWLPNFFGKKTEKETTKSIKTSNQNKQQPLLECYQSNYNIMILIIYHRVLMMKFI